MSSDERGRSPENIGSDLRTRGGLSLGVSRLPRARERTERGRRHDRSTVVLARPRCRDPGGPM